jgi:hypothetical protein
MFVRNQFVKYGAGQSTNLINIKKNKGYLILDLKLEKSSSANINTKGEKAEICKIHRK